MYAVVETKEDYYSNIGAIIKGASFFICEEAADVANLPTVKVGIGSRALVIPTGEIYMFGPSKKWIKYAGVSIMN